MLLLATCQLKHPPFHWRNQSLIPPMKGWVLQLASLSDMANAASCDLPIEMPPFALAESGPDSANEKGVVSVGRLIGHGKCCFLRPANGNAPPLHCRNQALILPMEREGPTLIFLCLILKRCHRRMVILSFLSQYAT